MLQVRVRAGGRFKRLTAARRQRVPLGCTRGGPPQRGARCLRCGVSHGAPMAAACRDGACMDPCLPPARCLSPPSRACPPTRLAQWSCLPWDDMMASLRSADGKCDIAVAGVEVRLGPPTQRVRLPAAAVQTGLRAGNRGVRTLRCTQPLITHPTLPNRAPQVSPEELRNGLVFTRRSTENGLSVLASGVGWGGGSAPLLCTSWAEPSFAPAGAPRSRQAGGLTCLRRTARPESPTAGQNDAAHKWRVVFHGSLRVAALGGHPRHMRGQ